MDAAQVRTEVDPAPVAQDWSRHFFSSSQDVSDEDIQKIWARILAGEVTRPGSFAKRTLDALRLIDKQEADLFAALASICFISEGRRFYFHAAATSAAMIQKN